MLGSLIIIISATSLPAVPADFDPFFCETSMFDAQTTASTVSPSKQTEGPTLVLNALRSERDALRSELRSTRLEVDMLRSELRRCEAARDGGTPLAVTLPLLP